MANPINDALRSVDELLCFDDTEIGKVCCIPAVDDPRVEDVEIVDVNDGRVSGIAGEELESAQATRRS